jgi:Na+-driven multidrug efflux pump
MCEAGHDVHFAYVYYLLCLFAWHLSHTVGLLLQIIPLVAFEGVFDAVNICGSGVFRGCGKQITGFMLNFVAYYVIGLPLGFFMVCRNMLFFIRTT